MKALYVLAGRGRQYDLVFFDPPYTSGLYQQVFEALDSLTLLSPGAILVAECSVRSSLQESYGRLKRFDRREYGETALELYITGEE